MTQTKLKLVNGPCWDWQRMVERRGYGVTRNGEKKVKAHRVMHEAFNGPIPADCEIHHLCGNKKCVNPDHLITITRGQHIHLGYLLGERRPSGRKRFCKRGHTFTDDNIIYEPRKDGKRVRLCKICEMARRAKKNKAFHKAVKGVEVELTE